MVQRTPADSPDEALRRAPHLAVPLRAGPLRLVFDGGALRWIRLGERPVLHGIYFALRDQGWATVPGTLEDLVITAEPESFRIRFVSVHRAGPVAFDWEGSIEGTVEGRVSFSVEGKALSSFLRNRIGLCVLHGAAACAGQPCTLEAADGTHREASFPALVSPHQPFLGLRAITHTVAPGVLVEVRMAGDVFETEDQRNWSDDSFKTYGTPLALPIPVAVAPGDRVGQAVVLSLRGAASEPVREAAAVRGALPRKRGLVEPVQVEVDLGRELPLPSIGLAGAGAVALDASEAEPLRALRLDHLRCELRLDASDWGTTIERAVTNARLVEAPLELALFLPEDPAQALRDLAARLRSLAPRVASILLFGASDATTHGGFAAAARERLGALCPGTLFAGGSDGHFVELNRRRPPSAGLDRISFALSPQVHATDDATLFENLSSLARIAETVRSFAPAAALGISPVTLRPRTERRSSSPPAAPAPDDDPRQRTLTAAAWTLGLVASAAQAGYASLSLFELVGPRGVLDEQGPYPVYQALAELLSSVPRAIHPARSSRPERVLALALPGDERPRVLLASLSSEPQRVRLSGPARAVRCCVLGGSEWQPSGLELELELEAHSILRLEVES